MSKYINTNIIHNILNILIIAVPALEVLDWTPLIGQEKSLVIVSALGVTKIVINILRDGLTGLTKTQPAVK